MRIIYWILKEYYDYRTFRTDDYGKKIYFFNEFLKNLNKFEGKVVNKSMDDKCNNKCTQEIETEKEKDTEIKKDIEVVKRTRKAYSIVHECWIDQPERKKR